MNITQDNLVDSIISNGNKDEEIDDESNSAKLFERSRIRALADERESVQKKTFCKWINSHLAHVGCKIQDLYVDLRDGKMLIKLLEVLSGEKLPNPTKGKMRIHCLENVDKSLTFLNEQKVHLENVGAHDIVDGNPRLTLGLIWTIILRFQIQDITLEPVGSSEVKSAKDALLLWCQMKTAGYPNVNVRNFTESWKNGLAFNAIIHKHRPDLIDYESLKKNDPMHNLNNAFNVAEEKLGLTKLLDPEDVLETPDEKSIITYVVTYYHYFSKMKADSVQGRRIGKVVNQCLEDKKMIENYERFSSDLLEWIKRQIESLNNRDFANSLAGVQDQLSAFNSYRTVEKPVKFIEKGELEILLFKIQSQMRGNNLKPYQPPEGKLVADINKAWEHLEKAEHERELALREELIRQEKLEQLASRCDRKASMREVWLVENQRLVSQDNFGYDMAAVEAAIKKHEAIETDIQAYEERVQAVLTVAKELECENYHDVDRINERKDNVVQLWRYLLELLQARRNRLELSYQLQGTFQDMLYILDMMDEIKARLQSEDYGKHLMGVEDLLKKHELISSEIAVIGSRVKATDVQKFIEGDPMTGYKPCDPEIVEDRLKHLLAAYEELRQLFEERNRKLLESRNMWQFESDLAEESAWIREKEQLMSSPDIGHDLTSVQLLLNKHKIDEDELRTHRTYLDLVLQSGLNLIDDGNIGAPRIQKRIDDVEKQWKDLNELSNFRKLRLEEAHNFYQLFSDADDVDAWMMDILRLISTDDIGKDEASIQTMIRKHKQLTSEIDSYENVIEALLNQATLLSEKDQDSPEVVERLSDTTERYKNLKAKSDLKRQQLLNALALHQLYNEADGVEQWISEKEKLVHSMVATEDIEEVEILKARYDTFENEIDSNADKVVVINQLAQQLLRDIRPDDQAIDLKQKHLNERWRGLRMLTDKKKESLDLACDVNQFHAECQETMTWIKDKEKLIESTDDLSNDLAGMISLQRRLSGLSRDLAVIQAKLKTLNENAEELAVKKPSEAAAMKKKLEALSERWDHLKEMMKSRDERLGEANEMQKFLQDLDHFQQWLSRTQGVLSSEDVPVDVATADAMLSDHLNVRDEINAYVADYRKMKEYGDRLVEDQEGTQYMFLRERLKALHHDWKDLAKMWESKNGRLSQNRDLQEFLKEVKQVEIMLSQQDNFLSKEETATSPEQVENMIKRHGVFESTLDANDEKIKSVLKMGQDLIDGNHYLSGKIQEKVDTIKQRQSDNQRKYVEKLNKLKNLLDVLKLFQECDELSDWIGEKLLMVQDETYGDAKTAHSRWIRHQAFEMELKSNRSRLEDIMSRADQLMAAKPDLKETVKPRVETLNKEWKLLEGQTKAKGEKLFENNKHIFYGQSCEEIDGWINEMESQIKAEEVHSMSIPINLIIRKQNILESQLKMKKHLLEELDKQEEVLADLEPEQRDELRAKKTSVANRFKTLLVPLSEKQKELELIKLRRQFGLDASEEFNWIEERLGRATSKETGRDLAAVQSLKNKNKSLQVEVANHEPRFKKVCTTGTELARSNPNQAEEYANLVATLIRKWESLQLALQERERLLQDSELLQQYLNDVSEANTWIAEQEFYLMSEDKARDETGAENIHKKHKDRELSIAEFEDKVRQLSVTSQQISSNVDSKQVSTKQRQLEKNYLNLKQLAAEKNHRLIEVIKLYKLHFEIEDLEQWIAQREVVASSQDCGQNFENVSILQERFKNFEEETKNIGSERVSAVNELCDGLIESGISDAPVVAEWKDGINESWTDLLELIETRNLALNASWQRFKLFNDCLDVLDQIKEKKLSLPGTAVEDTPQAVSALQRRLGNFENELLLIGNQVQGIQETASKLIVCYSGDKAQEIQQREEEVVKAFKDIFSKLELRKKEMANTFDVNKFFILAKDLILWMNEVHRQMDVSERPRDVSGVELLLNNHTSLKADIDSKDENFTICANLGKELFYRDHPLSNEIYNKLDQLAVQRGTLGEDWDKKWEYLQLIHEVYLFARDATVAETWIASHEPHIFSKYYGETIDVNEMLIKKHSALEKSIISQEERFAALNKLTELERLAREKEKSSKPNQIEKYRKEFLPMKKDEIRKSIPTINVPSPAVSQKETTPMVSTSPEILQRERPMPPPVSPTAGDQSPASPKIESPQKPSKSSSFKITRSSSSGKDKRPKEPETKTLPLLGAMVLDGALNRKHEWENTIQKSPNRAWERIFVVLTDQHTLASFKDAKHAKTPTDPKAYFRQETPIDLIDEKARAIVATDYVKRPHVFRLKLESGAEYLFQCKDENEMTTWISEINRQANIGEEENRFLTLPPNPVGSKSEPKKRSRFSFRKSKE